MYFLHPLLAGADNVDYDHTIIFTGFDLGNSVPGRLGQQIEHSVHDNCILG